MNPVNKLVNWNSLKLKKEIIEHGEDKRGGEQAMKGNSFAIKTFTN